MKHLINKMLAKFFRLQLRSANREPKENPEFLNFSTGRKLIYYYDLVRRIESVEGDIVECGIGWGRSLYALCLSTLLLDLEKKVYGFDSFQGFPEPTIKDASDIHIPKKGHYKTGQESVVNFLKKSGLPGDFLENNLVIVEGFFNESLKKYNGNQVALLHIDADLYQSYMDCLSYFYPKVAPGGIIALDEYHERKKYPGAKKAVDEFFDGKERPVRSKMIKRYYITKS